MIKSHNGGYMTGRKVTHGQGTPGKQTKAYWAWTSMKRRCDKPKCHNYKNYGARGIIYDPSWKRFENFFEDMGVAPEGSSLERIDNDGNYCKENCRWATPKEQANNTRTNKRIEHDGKTLTITEWANLSGMSLQAFRQRLLRGWSMEDAISAPAINGSNQYKLRR
jgi:hypothetical protein